MFLCWYLQNILECHIFKILYHNWIYGLGVFFLKWGASAYFSHVLLLQLSLSSKFRLKCHSYLKTSGILVRLNVYATHLCYTFIHFKWKGKRVKKASRLSSYFPSNTFSFNLKFFETLTVLRNKLLNASLSHENLKQENKSFFLFNKSYSRKVHFL